KASCSAATVNSVMRSSQFLPRRGRGTDAEGVGGGAGTTPGPAPPPRHAGPPSPFRGGISPRHLLVDAVEAAAAGQHMVRAKADRLAAREQGTDQLHRGLVAGGRG